MNDNIGLPSFEKSETLVQKIYYSLEEAILQGKMKPNDRLIEEDLSRMFGISRAPIREALRLLEKDGLVRITPRKGALIQSISKEDIADIYEIRSVLEGLAARLFCERGTDEEMKALELVIRKAEVTAHQKDGARKSKKYVKLNRDFHDILIKGSRNKKIMYVYSSIQKQINWFQNVTLSYDTRFELSLQEHRELLDCCLKRDSGGAEEKARRHIENAAAVYLAKCAG